jgi:Ca-activated chloride channel family protein
MRQRYAHLDPEVLRRLLESLGLKRLFQQLVLATSGDVEEAMEWMRHLQREGYIQPDVDLEAFFAQLEAERLIQRDADGQPSLTVAAERQIRRSAFEEVFSGLHKAGPGYHPIPASGDGVERQPETRAYRFGDELHGIDSVR